MDIHGWLGDKLFPEVKRRPVKAAFFLHLYGGKPKRYALPPVTDQEDTDHLCVFHDHEADWFNENIRICDGCKVETAEMILREEGHEAMMAFHAAWKSISEWRKEI